jgi:hypothetical protein
MQPLEQLIPKIITGATESYLQPDQAIRLIRSRQGVIPITILPSSECKAVLNSPYERIAYLNYDRLTKQGFANILRGAFHYTATPDQLTLMQAQFDYYSKDDSGTARFVCDKAKKRNAVTPEIREAVEYKLITLYNQLEQSKKTLIPAKQVSLI